jgi:DNA-directed RNA polymerase sigma subunit (sigma70/sigma32)
VPAWGQAVEEYAKHELLTHAQEVELHRKFQAGGIEGKRAFDELVRCNMRLVISGAQAFQVRAGHVNDFEDLCHMGVIGLIRAIEKWEPERGLRFST